MAQGRRRTRAARQIDRSVGITRAGGLLSSDETLRRVVTELWTT
jgi:hypothetical protein